MVVTYSMKTDTPLINSVLRVLTLVGCWLALAIALPAQTAGTGIIQGRVFNPVSQEYVRNAEVRLDGTNQVTYTENDGTFSFRNVPAGPASISVTFTGYNSARETLTVSAGQTATREINLTSTAAGATGGGVVQLQAFTVASEREGNAKAIMDQRRNMDITTSVSSDIFGDVADGNVGEFLKYLPGVDLDYVESEARGPRLGGMDGQYVGVSFDGQRTASADANRGGGDASRATSFEGFSITAIESIEISRTTSAESDADSPAGTINMKTKRAFDRKGRRMAFNFAMNFNAEEMTLKKTEGPRDGKSYKWKPNLTLDYSESFLNQRLGILLSASRANSYTEQYQVSNGHNRTPIASDPRPLVIRQIDFKDGNKTILKDAFMLTADYRATPNLILSLNAIYTYTEGEFWNRNFTWVAANDNANVNVANGRASIEGDGLTVIGANRVGSGSTAGSKTNTVATLNNGGGTSSKLTYTRTISPKFEFKMGSWIVDGAMNYSRSVNNYESLERGFSNSEGGGVPSSFIASRPHPESWEWTIRQTGGNDWYDLRSFVDTNARSGGTRVNNDNRTWITTILSGSLNARYVVPIMERFPTILKFGGKVAEESRDNNQTTEWDIFSYVGPGGNTAAPNAQGVNVNSAFGSWANLGFISPHPFDMGTTNGLTVFNINGAQGMPPRADRQRIAGLYNARPELFMHMGNADNYYNSFIAPKRDFKQTISSAYMQADVRLTAKMQIRTGVRIENTLNEVREFDPRLRADLVARGFPLNAAGRATTIEGLQYQYQSQPRITRESEYHNYFPSILLKYQILRNLEFQAGHNRAISRPPIDNLTGLWIVDDVNQRISAPNPELPPEHSKNYQTRLAYYFGGRSPGQLSAAFSQNNIRNLRETFDYSADEFGVEDEEFLAYTFRSTRISTEARRFRNMELSYNQTLGFLTSEYLRGINLNFAYTRSYASQRRNNLSPHRVSSRIGYSYRRLNTSLGMIWRDVSPDGVYGRYKRELTQFDASATWRLNSRYSLYVQGRNITGKPVIWMESPPGLLEGQSPSLRTMQEYGANWVFGCRGQF